MSATPTIKRSISRLFFFTCVFQILMSFSEFLFSSTNIYPVSPDIIVHHGRYFNIQTLSQIQRCHCSLSSVKKMDGSHNQSSMRQRYIFSPKVEAETVDIHDSGLELKTYVWNWPDTNLRGYPAALQRIATTSTNKWALIYDIYIAIMV